MKRKFRNIICLVCILIILCGLLFNARLLGVYFWHNGGFTFGFTHTMFKEHFKEMETTFVTLKPSNPKSAFGIPYVFCVIPLEEHPYNLNIILNDRTEKMKRIVLTTIVINYDDGSEKQIEREIVEGFKADYTRTTTGDGGYFDSPVMRLDMTINRIVEKFRSFNLTLKGYFVDLSENKIPFETEESFEYESPYWDICSGVGGRYGIIR